MGVIQGDGINISTLEDISVAVKQAGFAANNVAYGTVSTYMKEWAVDSFKR